MLDYGHAGHYQTLHALFRSRSASVLQDVKERPFSKSIIRLRDAGLRPTRQRLALAKLLFEGPDRHITAEILHEEVEKSGASVSLATVYNTLNQFTAASLLREVVVGGGRTYFDTNISEHHHFYHEAESRLEDIPQDQVDIAKLPTVPKGKSFSRIEVVIHVSDVD